MHALAISTRLSLHQHPWMMDFIGGRPPTGPKSLRNLERVLASFDGLGLNSAAAVDIVTTVGTYVLGAVLREVQERNNESFRDQQFAGLTEDEVQRVLAEFTERVRASGRYPRLLAMLDDRHDPDAAETRDARFEFGLECLLDGIAAHLSSRPARRPVPPPRHSQAAATSPRPASPAPAPRDHGFLAVSPDAPAPLLPSPTPTAGTVHVSGAQTCPFCPDRPYWTREKRRIHDHNVKACGGWQGKRGRAASRGGSGKPPG